ncbi:MAG TPA: 50S ribosomal protein L4 [Alphaproteobacteria bacterium]|jgi:large subunit ribosomal protein L4|nr:50S ribosomal protein L4 [Alphaproteobacteria bacterium]MCB9985660.1 50S ribosomal protein L4 [Micavibrio sp.]HRK98301.1 50S ribosomal protein L4 [Alphaproteobacteria bacterium]
MKVAVKTLDNKDVGNIELNDSVFGVEIRADIMHRMVHYQLNKRRAGTHKTKGVSDVSGTGKKPWNQKGTGRSRASTMRAAHFVGGATIFGPVVRSHATELPKKQRMLALKTALSAKAASGQLVIVDTAAIAEPKTKTMTAKLSALGIRSALFVCGEDMDRNFALATRNIPHIDVLPCEGANVYDILRHDILVLTKDAVENLTKRLSA